VNIVAMPLPSLYPGNEGAHAQSWRLTRAAAYGAAIGVAAALFKMLAPTGERVWSPVKFLEVVEAALAFALLCAAAAFVRNILVRRFVKRA
jgi:hypothetical protein